MIILIIQVKIIFSTWNQVEKFYIVLSLLREAQINFYTEKFANISQKSLQHVWRILFSFSYRLAWSFLNWANKATDEHHDKVWNNMQVDVFSVSQLELSKEAWK